MFLASPSKVRRHHGPNAKRLLHASPQIPPWFSRSDLFAQLVLCSLVSCQVVKDAGNCECHLKKTLNLLYKPSKRHSIQIVISVHTYRWRVKLFLRNWCITYSIYTSHKHFICHENSDPLVYCNQFFYDTFVFFGYIMSPLFYFVLSLIYIYFAYTETSKISLKEKAFRLGWPRIARRRRRLSINQWSALRDDKRGLFGIDIFQLIIKRWW